MTFKNDSKFTHLYLISLPFFLSKSLLNNKQGHQKTWNPEKTSNLTIKAKNTWKDLEFQTKIIEKHGFSNYFYI